MNEVTEQLPSFKSKDGVKYFAVGANYLFQLIVLMRIIITNRAKELHHAILFLGGLTMRRFKRRLYRTNTLCNIKVRPSLDMEILSNAISITM